MRSSPSRSVNAQSSSGLMAHTTATMSLFTRDLEHTSVGSPGRALMGVIESLGFDTLGASRPLDLALALQEATPERDALVGRYLEAAARDPQLVNLVMVAITPAVEATVARCASYIGRSAFTEELLVTLLEQLQGVGEQPPALRRRWLATTAVASARATTRSSRRRALSSIAIADDFDLAEVSGDDGWREELLAAMWMAVGTVISTEDFVLIDCTRAWGVELEWMAQHYAISYDAARKRRARAEARVRDFIRAEVAR